MKTFDHINTLLGGNEIASNWSQHPNGGGWVRNDAEVHPEAYIGEEAIVLSSYRKAQVMRGGVMRGGVMRGGEMCGGVMRGGEWETSPLFVQGSKHCLANAKPGYLQIGCRCESYLWWASKEALQFARDNGYTDKEIKEYKAYVALFKKIGRPAED